MQSVRTHTRTQSTQSTHTHKVTHTIIIIIKGKTTMQDKDFLDFVTKLNTNTTKGAARYNLKNNNMTKRAKELLLQSNYKALGNPEKKSTYIKPQLVEAYHNNKDFKDKLDEVMAHLGISIVA